MVFQYMLECLSVIIILVIYKLIKQIKIII